MALEPLRVLLADDHTLVRSGMRSLLENLDGIEIVAETGDGQAVLDLIKKHHPDIVLMDISMPGLNGLEATARVAKQFPQVRVLILSVHADEEHVLQALRAGAVGYLLKDAAASDLELAIRAVARGDTYLSPSISRQVIDAYLGQSAGLESPLEQLTPRQREILQLIAEGKNTKEIAFLLKVSVKTVESHRSQLMERLAIHDVPGLVRLAMRAGLISPNP
jgi:DNA-binding NarL/FixJ family response regulator